MAKGLKWNVYVGVITADGISVVTDIDNSTKAAYWKSGQKGKKFTLTTAKDLVFGLTVNGYSAFVIQTLGEMNNP